MSSETRYVCDRCGKRELTSTYSVHVASIFDGRRTRAICESCRESFKQWWKGVD